VTRHAMVGPVSGELLTLGGRVLVHDNAAELGFLFPAARVVTLPPHIPPEDTLPVAAHPELASVRFPLDRRDFQ
jgi:hypothetical protein